MFVLALMFVLAARGILMLEALISLVLGGGVS